jgi:hypothetical protein
MKNSLLTIVLFLLIGFGTANGQEVKLTNDFEFKSGLYLSFESFKNNTPDLTWSEVQYDAFSNKEKRSIQFKYLNGLDTNDEQKTIPLDTIWGFCAEGIPYIRVDIPSRSTSEFTVLRTRGRICYFTYEAYVIKEIPMTIYDPNSGRPILQKNIQNEELITIEKIMSFETGEIEMFKLRTFKKWIKKTDEKLMATLEDFNDAQASDKLYKSMLIFNDRNPVYVSNE